MQKTSKLCAILVSFIIILSIAGCHIKSNPDNSNKKNKSKKTKTMPNSTKKNKNGDSQSVMFNYGPDIFVDDDLTLYADKLTASWQIPDDTSIQINTTHLPESFSEELQQLETALNEKSCNAEKALELWIDDEQDPDCTKNPLNQIGMIFFDNSNANIREDQKLKIKILAKNIGKSLGENGKILITGHCDQEEPKDLLKLSKDRAKNVKDELIKIGIEKSKIEICGAGDQEPIIWSNKSEKNEVHPDIKNQSPNSRVEIFLAS